MAEIPSTAGPKRPGNPNWYPGMPSPNKAGRPPGITNRRQKVNQALMENALPIIEKVVQNALKGDTQAAALALSRVLPAVRPQREYVEFELDATAPPADQAASVLAAVAAGLVSPDVGREIVGMIESVHGIRQMDEVVRRLDALEGRDDDLYP